MTRAEGGPKQPYTTGYVNTTELHFVKAVADRIGADDRVQWEMECGRIAAVTDLKDRSAAEIVTIGEWCHGCAAVLWTYQLVREAKR